MLDWRGKKLLTHDIRFISWTVKDCPSKSTRSPTSKGCFAKVNTHDPSTSWAVDPISHERPSRNVPADVTSVVSLVVWARQELEICQQTASCKKVKEAIKRGGGTDDHGGEDEHADEQDDRHEDVVQSRDGPVEVAHRGRKRQSLAVDLHQRHLNLVSGRAAVAVSVEDLKRLVRNVEGGEVAGNVGDLDLLLALAERVVDSTSELM